SAEVELDALTQVHRAYNSVGITSIFERRTNVDGWRTYLKLREQGRLTVRSTLTIGLGGDGTEAGTEKFIRALPFKVGDGDEFVLDAVEAANADSPIKERRYTLIHAYFPTAGAVRRAAALGVCVDTQPAWYFKDADAIVTALGEARLKNFIGVADWLRGGVKVALNTHHMSGLDPNHALNPFTPFLTMGTAVTRKTE